MHRKTYRNPMEEEQKNVLALAQRRADALQAEAKSTQARADAASREAAAAAKKAQEVEQEAANGHLIIIVIIIIIIIRLWRLRRI